VCVCMCLFADECCAFYASARVRECARVAMQHAPRACACYVCLWAVRVCVAGANASDGVQRDARVEKREMCTGIID